MNATSQNENTTPDMNGQKNISDQPTPDTHENQPESDDDICTIPEENTETDPNTSSNANITDQLLQIQQQADIDPEVLALRNKPLHEQLWFFIDDVIPTSIRDTELILCEIGASSGNMPAFTFMPKSLDIFEEIANIPHHSLTKYPSMAKYFGDIINLYNNYVKPDINPYWSIEPIGIPAQIMTGLYVAVKNGQQAVISLTPKQGSLPFRLTYGDDSHTHDYVGIVYVCLK